MILVRCLEAIFFLAQRNLDQELLKWTETVTEAFFLQLSVFGGQNASDPHLTEETSYAEDLIERIQRRIDQHTNQIEFVETLAGQIDSIVEQRNVLAAKLAVKQRTQMQA